MTLDEIARQFINALSRAVDEDEPTDEEWHGEDPEAVATREQFTASVRQALTDWLRAPATIAAIAQTLADEELEEQDAAQAVSDRLIATLESPDA